MLYFGPVVESKYPSKVSYMKTILTLTNPTGKIGHILLACIMLLLATEKVDAQSLPGPSANLQTLPTGSLIIPMDNTYQTNGSSLFNLKAYGLIIHLLNNGVKVKWVIAAGKAKDGTDFSATTALVTPTTNATPTLRDFKGGPFIILAPDTAGVIALVNSFNAANALAGNARPKVQRTLLPSVADIRYDLQGFRPKAAVLNDGGSQAIHVAYMTAASIPAINYAVSAGRDLITGCYTFASEPHNGDSNPIVDTAIMSIRDFVEYGGNFLAQCAAVENYENSVHGRFQTTTGITETGIGIGTTVNMGNADLSYSQVHGLVSGEPGGSVENWRINGSGINNNHNHITGTGANGGIVTASVSKLTSGVGGMVFYLGGHNYRTDNQTEINGVRMFMNAFLTPSVAPCTFMLLNSDIKSFVGSVKDDTAELKWTISENENVEYFDIEKSNDGKQFRTVGTVSKISLKGTATYSFVEGTRITGYSYYRIILHSNTSSRKYSKTITLTEASDFGNASVRLMENPVTSTLAFNYASAGGGVNELSIYNSAGNRIYSTKLTVQKGSNVFHLPVEHITSKGLYYVEIINSRERSIARFIKK
jgi:hypothetical protein